MYKERYCYLPRDILDVHKKQIAEFGESGHFWSAIDKRQIIDTARRAAADAGLQESVGNAESNVGSGRLSNLLLSFIEKLAVNPKDIVREDYEQLMDDGVSPEAYTELVGIVARLSALDVTARGMGEDLADMPVPENGSPDGRVFKEATAEEAWIPTVPNGRKGGQASEELYGDEFQPYIYRSLSCSPREFKANKELSNVQYIPDGKFMQFDFRHFLGLSRPQVEVVAGRVSFLNSCFY